MRRSSLPGPLTVRVRPRRLEDGSRAFAGPFSSERPLVGASRQRAPSVGAPGVILWPAPIGEGLSWRAGPWRMTVRPRGISEVAED